MADAHKLEILRGLVKFKSNTQKIWGVLILLSIITAVEVALGIYKPESLMSKVQGHRQSVGGDLSPGWQHRLGTKVVEQNPKATAHCSVDESRANYRVKVSAGDIGNFIFSMKKWAMTGGVCVEAEEAERRANICSSCPHNSKAVGCSSCMQILPKVMGMVGNKTTTHDDVLESCDRCSCSLRAKVWLPMEVVAGGKVLTLPSSCWMKGEVDEITPFSF